MSRVADSYQVLVPHGGFTRLEYANQPSTRSLVGRTHRRECYAAVVASYSRNKRQGDSAPPFARCSLGPLLAISLATSGRRPPFQPFRSSGSGLMQTWFGNTNRGGSKGWRRIVCEHKEIDQTSPLPPQLARLEHCPGPYVPAPSGRGSSSVVTRTHHCSIGTRPFGESAAWGGDSGKSTPATMNAASPSGRAVNVSGG